MCGGRWEIGWPTGSLKRSGPEDDNRAADHKGKSERVIPGDRLVHPVDGKYAEDGNDLLDGLEFGDWNGAEPRPAQRRMKKERRKKDRRQAERRTKPIASRWSG